MQTLYLLTDSQYALVSTIIEPKQRKRKTDLRLLLSGVIYLLMNGCKWQGLPPVYGPFKTVWYYYNKWAVLGRLEDALYALNMALRTKQGRSGEPSLLIVDTQSVKTTAGTWEQVGYDGGKKVKGRKRSIAVDKQGNVMAAGVGSAALHDKRAVVGMRQDVEDIKSVEKITADGAFKGVPPFTAGGRIEWQIVERKATGGRFKVLPRRWVVERTFAWLSFFRRLSKDYEKTVVMAKAMIVMTAIVITIRKLTT